MYNMQNPFCKYKNAFGEPNTGIRKYRIMNIAIYDTLLVLVIAIALAWFFRLPYIPTIVGIYLLGIVAHRLFCVQTGVDIMLFGK
ncbi:hypothetical protein EB093_09145 [bacterium]|nr:hypothetical protein [bacterium]